jgi:hypothetical protein
MIYNWNEINYENFEEVFDGFFNREPWSDGKVLEVQNILGSVAEPLKTLRLYFSRSFSDSDIRLGLEEPMLNLLIGTNKQANLAEMMNRHNTMIMGTFINGRYRVTPVMRSNIDRIKMPLFGDLSKKNSIKSGQELPLPAAWYTKSSIPGKINYFLNSDKTNFSNKERFIRCRSIDRDDWRDIIDTFLNTGVMTHAEDDIKANKVISNI